jgi:DNA-binding CsgD family transcriptional regulator
MGGKIMANVSEHDWHVINNILLEIYSLDDIKDIANEFLSLIRAIIPYSKAYFILFKENQSIDQENSSFYNVTEENINGYINYFYNIDYVSYIFNFTKPITFKDTDIIEDDLREKTEFYQGFLLPQNIPYGGGILFVKENKILGLLNLFRSKELGDITQRELSILEIIKDHLNNILFSTSLNSKATDGRKSLKSDDFKRYNLSNRENEILKLLIKGSSNNEIGKILCISVSTVKKHVYNIFTKIGVNSRMQLIKFIQRDS